VVNTKIDGCSSPYWKGLIHARLGSHAKHLLVQTARFLLKYPFLTHKIASFFPCQSFLSKENVMLRETLVPPQKKK
jgi:hypothetical protein